MPAPLTPSPRPIAAVQTAHYASTHLALSTGRLRSQAVQCMATALKQRQQDILEANTLDLEASREMAVPDLILDWLKLTPERLQAAIQILQRLGDLPDPLGRVMTTNHPMDQCQSYAQLMPLGVIALVYEAFPELGAIAAGMCVKTGNSIVLKGSSESSTSNAVIAEVLAEAIADSGLPEGCFQSLPADQGSTVRDLISQDQYLSLVIPYGRPSLVQQIVRQSTTPVLETAIGNCYLYWTTSGSVELALWMILDSHQTEPDPINAIEKVLIHRDHPPSSLTRLWKHLRDRGFQLRGDAALVAQYPDLLLAEAGDWHQAYLKETIAFKMVEDLESAIAWINTYSSGHADCLATESYRESRQFAMGVNSASTYINASPRFTRRPERGDAIFLGMSNQKGLRRGLISLETLTTVKQIVQGMGRL
jgi:glutamate-5-semialdehyde dehydrogenase